jgi:hypothetical protein
MIELTYQHTIQERNELYRLNGHPIPSRWKALVFTALAISPSIVLLFLTKSFLLVSIGIVLLVILAAMFVANWFKSSRAYLPEITIQISENSLREKVSHSVCENKWHRFGGFRETELSFQLKRTNSRFILIPKRSVPVEHHDSIRSLFREREQTNAPDVPHVDGYQRFETANADEVIEFNYLQQDLRDIGPTWQDILKQNRSKQRRFVNGFIWLGIWVGLVFLMFVLFPYGSQQLTQQEQKYLYMAIATPIAAMIFLRLWVRLNQTKKRIEIPVDKNKLLLLSEGFCVGNKDSITVYDWRDVETIFWNRSCYAFKTLNNLLVFFPKRIFRDENHQRKFVERAANLMREHQRNFETPVVGAETGNPYQAPKT